jgi:hypothetical protein
MGINVDPEVVLTFDDGFAVQLRKGSRRSLLAAWLVPPSSTVDQSVPPSSRLLRSDCAKRAAEVEPYFRGWGRKTNTYAYFGPDIPVASYIFEIFGSIALLYTDAHDDEPAGALPISMMNVELPPNEAATFEKKSLFSSICEGKPVFELRLSTARGQSVILAWTDPDERAVWKKFMIAYISRIDTIIDGALLRDCLPILGVEGGMAIVKRRSATETSDAGSKRWMYLLWTGDPADWSILICKEAVADEMVSLGLCKIPGLECKRFPLGEIEDAQVEAEPSTSLRITVLKSGSARNQETSKSIFFIDSDPADRSKSLLWVDAIRGAKSIMQRLMDTGDTAKQDASDTETPDFRDKVFLASLQGKLLPYKKDPFVAPDVKPTKLNWFSRSFGFSSKNLLETDKNKPSDSAVNESNSVKKIDIKKSHVAKSAGAATHSEFDSVVAASQSGVGKKAHHEPPLHATSSETVSAVQNPQQATDTELGNKGADERSSRFTVDSRAAVDDEFMDDSEEEDDLFHDDDAHDDAQRLADSGAIKDSKETPVSCFAFLFRWIDRDNPDDTIASPQPKSRRASLVSDANLPIPGGHGDVVRRGTPKLKRVSFFSSETGSDKEVVSSEHVSPVVAHDSRDFGNVDAKLKNRLWAANADEIIRADALAMKPAGAVLPNIPESRDESAPKPQTNETPRSQNKNKASLTRESSFLEQIETEYYSPDQDSDSDSQSNSKVQRIDDHSKQERSKASREVWWEGVDKHSSPASPRVIALTLRQASKNPMSNSSRQLNPPQAISRISVSSMHQEDQMLSGSPSLARQRHYAERPESTASMSKNGRLGASPVANLNLSNPVVKPPSIRETIIKSSHEKKPNSSSDASNGRILSESYFVNARLRDIDLALELRRIELVLHPVPDALAVSEDAIARIYLSGRSGFSLW